MQVDNPEFTGKREHMNMKKNGFGRCRITRYTLIELLVVIGVMAILLGISGPAFVSMMRGQGKDIAARSISSMLKLSRDYAVTQREHVAILFPESGSGLSDEYKYSHFRPCIVWDADSSSGTDWRWRSWIDGSSWNKLPTGLVSQIVTTAQAETVNDADCTDIGATSTEDFDRAIIFTPSGRTTRTSNIEFKISQGIVSGGAIQSTDATNVGITVTVNPYTARLSFEDK
jgi:prepilin-type N-terminal cleavage/methylation domain-containing protein